MIHYAIEKFNLSFTYHLNISEQHNLAQYIEKMIKCPREKLIHVTYSHCPYANEMNSYIYICCDINYQFINLQYHALSLDNREVMELLKMIEKTPNYTEPHLNL